jgi:serine/threonine protein kinase
MMRDSDTASACWQSLFPEGRFLARIGQGAYGEVWLLELPGNRHVAAKLMARQAAGDAAERYSRERRALDLIRTLPDPPGSLIRVLDLREDLAAGFVYTMPLADPERARWTDDPGQYRPRTLRGELSARRALPLADCLDIGIRLAETLTFLQAHHLVHRDIKPSNVLLIDGQAVLADLGLLADTREADSRVGTPGYAPDELQGRFTGDIFSLGVLLRELSTGRGCEEHGFAPVDEAEIGAPGFARWLDILRRATDPNPERRYQTAAALLRDLRLLRENRGQPRPTHRRRLQTLAAGLLLAALGVALARVPPTFHRRPSGSTAMMPGLEARDTFRPRVKLEVRDSSQPQGSKVERAGRSGARAATPLPVPAPVKTTVHPSTSSKQSATIPNPTATASVPRTRQVVSKRRPATQTGYVCDFWRLETSSLEVYLSESDARAGTYMQVFRDRLLVGSGATENWRDWRVVLIWKPADPREPGVTILSLSLLPPDNRPGESPLMVIPQGFKRFKPVVWVRLPPEMYDDTSHFPVRIYLTTDQPDYWTAYVAAIRAAFQRDAAGIGAGAVETSGLEPKILYPRATHQNFHTAWRRRNPERL